MHLIKNKKQIIFSLLLAVISIACLFIFYKSFYEKSVFQVLEMAFSIFFILATVFLNLVSINIPASINKYIFKSISTLLSTILIFIMTETFSNNTVTSMSTISVIFNLIVIFIIIWILYSLTGRLRISVITTAWFCYILALINDAVSLFRGFPISFVDIASINTALSVADSYVYPLNYSFWCSTFLLIFIFPFSKFTTHKITKKVRLINSAACAAVTFSFFCCFYGFYTSPDTTKPLLNTPDPSTSTIMTPHQLFISQWDPLGSYKQNGLLVSIALSAKNLNSLYVKDYNKEGVNTILSEQEDTVTQSNTEKPNIIVVMNESFSDLSVINPDFSSSEEVLPYYNSLKGSANAITGDLSTSTFGGKTANSEFEFLTGATTAFFPPEIVAYRQNLQKNSPSLVSTLKNQGYTTSAIHPFVATAWGRDYIYPEVFGFSEFQDVSKFPPEQSLPAIGAGLSVISDQAMYNSIFDRLENKQADEKLFLFNVTIQNHGGYSSTTGLSSHLKIKNLSTEYAEANSYISLMRESDKALESLIEYLKVYDEDTIVVFFGDHQANLGDDFYNDLYGSNLSEAGPVALHNKFKTPFLIWANYDIDEVELDNVSANYLSSIMLKYTGLEMPAYNEYLYNLSQDYPVICYNGYMKKDDDTFYHFSDPNNTSEAIDDYEKVQYNLLHDSKNRNDSFFVPKK